MGLCLHHDPNLTTTFSFSFDQYNRNPDLPPVTDFFITPVHYGVYVGRRSNVSPSSPETDPHPTSRSPCPYVHLMGFYLEESRYRMTRLPIWVLHFSVRKSSCGPDQIGGSTGALSSEVVVPLSIEEVYWSVYPLR